MTAFSKPIQLQEGCGIEDFECGDPVVDLWVARHSSSSRKRGTAVVYVSYSDEKAAGFYTLSTHSVARLSVTGGWFTRNAPDPVPAILLGMMGVDRAFKGQGLDAALLRDAIENALKVAELAGAKALIVDPTGPEAESFYGHFGFRLLPGTKRMAIPLNGK